MVPYKRCYDFMLYRKKYHEPYPAYTNQNYSKITSTCEK